MIERILTREENEVEWSTRLVDDKEVLAPTEWSDTAVRIAATKYFSKDESSVDDMIRRVVNTITSMGIKQGYFGTEGGTDALSDIFSNELYHILVNQYAFMNSPVMFNLGVKGSKQASSACYILDIQDNMESIMDKVVEMSALFKGGSGAGASLGKLRSGKEFLSSGGRPSGSVSFMKGYDSCAGVVKSAGKNRRAALLMCLPIDHGDILEFIRCKAEEEKKAHFMIDAAGILSKISEVANLKELDHSILALTAKYLEDKSPGTLSAIKFLSEIKESSLVPAELQSFIDSKNWYSFNENTAYETVAFQNMNISISMTDAFMNKITWKDLDDTWYLLARQEHIPTIIEVLKDTAQGRLINADGILCIEKDLEELYPVLEETKASILFSEICEAAHFSGDPGIQFIDRINEFNTLKHIGDIESSNPCLAGDTWITTNFGKQKIKDLVGLSFNVLSFDIEDKRNVFTNGRAFLSKKDAELVLVRTSSDNIKCTPDHRFLVRNMFSGSKFDLSWVPAKDLQSGMELFSEDINDLYKSEVVYEVIELEETQDVYDITVKETHNFYAGGICVHNCGEFLSLNNTSCNLASIRLTKFRNADNSFDYPLLQHVVRVIILAQDILIAESDYPTDLIKENSIKYRNLGLGVSDAGNLLMQLGLAYDSDEGRNYLAAIFSLISSTAYLQSLKMGQSLGCFDAYNKDVYADVLSKYTNASSELLERWSGNVVVREISAMADQQWDRLRIEAKNGSLFRNATVTAQAPTGTIAFLMDCRTTGIEPCIGLITTKYLVGGGSLQLVNDSVHNALKNLGYPADERAALMSWVMDRGHLEGTGILEDKDLPIFDCALRVPGATRTIEPMGHVKMLEAIQPFISQGISKTCNVSSEATPEDIAQVYIEAYKRGVKSITVYRDNSKKIQPLVTAGKDAPLVTYTLEHWIKELEEGATNYLPRSRKRLPTTRQSITHKFEVAGHEGYITVGLYENGRPGEIFIHMSKQGSTIAGLMDSFATSISLGIQYGVPLDIFIEKFAHTRFEPTGWTKDERIPIAKSVIDYIFRWMAAEFLSREVAIGYGVQFPNEVTGTQMVEFISELDLHAKVDTDAPICSCGNIMIRSGSCWTCQCGNSAGGCG